MPRPKVCATGAPSLHRSITRRLSALAAGSYPQGAPAQFLIPPSVFASREDLGHFPDVAPAAGVDVFGTAGGVIIDDFENNGLLDIVTSQIDGPPAGRPP